MLPTWLLCCIVGLLLCSIVLHSIAALRMAAIEARLNDIFPPPPAYPLRRSSRTTAAHEPRHFSA